jgi:5'-nucleotidase
VRILVTNDDGIRAEGIQALALAATAFGRVKVVAPDRERSACGHSMTMRDPLRVHAVNFGPGELGEIEAYEVSGVPVDCVNVGLTLAWPEGCDLVLSGFNHGPNLGFDVTYSGTVAGAMEGAVNGIRSIAFSMASFIPAAPLRLETGARWVRENLMALCETPLGPRTFLNVNVPALDWHELRGFRVVPMAGRVYQDRVEMRSDPWGRPYYWQGGTAVNEASQPGTDLEAVSAGFVSVTALSLDWTDPVGMAKLAEGLGARL